MLKRGCGLAFVANWISLSRFLARRILFVVPAAPITTERAGKALWEILTSSQCQDCGESDPIVLQFDHRDPALKLNDVGFLAKYGKRKKMLAEIEKCDIVCANCHTRRTGAMFGNWRLRKLA